MCTATPRPHWPWTSVKRSPSTTEHGAQGGHVPPHDTRRVLVVFGQAVGEPRNSGVQLAAAEFFGRARRRRLPTLSSSTYGRQRKGRVGFRDNLVNTYTGRGLDQGQTVVGDVDDGEVGEDTPHAALTG